MQTDFAFRYTVHSILGSDPAFYISNYITFLFRQRHKELSHRLLRCLAMQSLLQQYTISIDSAEEKLETRLEALNASLIAPDKIKVSNL